MSEKILFITSLIACAHVANSASAPFITRCTSEDAKCIKKSTEVALPIIAAGIPELGVEPLDPLHYKKLDASSKNLKLILNDITIDGVKDCVPKKMQRDTAKSKIFVKVLCTVTLKGQYEMSGRLLFIPIEGKGKAYAKLNQVLLSAEVDMGEKIKDGKKYWDVKGWKHSYELKDNAKVELENLFNGNEVLGRAAKELLSSNANDVVAEVGPPIIQALVGRVVKIVNNFFHKVPADELALD